MKSVKHIGKSMVVNMYILTNYFLLCARHDDTCFTNLISFILPTFLIVEVKLSLSQVNFLGFPS